MVVLCFRDRSPRAVNTCYFIRRTPTLQFQEMDGSDEGCDCDERAERTTVFSIPKLLETDACLNCMTELNLSSSNIAEVPEIVGSLSCIVALDLSSNELCTLPESFTEFRHLTRLNLSRNKFTSMPKCLIDGMRCVASLDLSHNRLLSINTKPFCVRQLVTLNVSNNLKLINLPRWLWSIECDSLESLDVSFTHCLEDIEVDPYLNMYGIGKHLKNLNVTNTNSNIYKLNFVKHLKNLRTIVLDNKVTTLNTHRNYFSNVPSIFNCRFKFIISLSINNVNLSSVDKRIYFNLPNLQFLSLSNNSIVYLPDSFSELTKLEVCDFSNNQILEFPKCFKSWTRLKKLILNNNWLSIFPKIIEDLVNLQFLDLYANKLVECPSWNINSNIDSIDLEQNIFSTENNFDQNIQANYSNMLKNLRSSINESRIIGPIYVDDYNGFKSFDESVGSSSHSSLSSISEYSPCEDSQSDTNFKPEELWECDSYEHTTAIFDPKEFELNLMNELIASEKLLTVDQKIKEKNAKNAIHLINEHYFCPSDDFL